MAKRKRRKRPSIFIGIFLAGLVLVMAMAAAGSILLREAIGNTESSSLFTRESGSVELGTLFSRNYVLMGRYTGTIYSEKGGEERIYPASMTKIMTVLTALENLEDLNAAVTMPQEIYPSLYAEDASMAGFEPGETVTCRDLLYGAMLPSGAECCETLARTVAGTEEAFVEQMNEKARELKMTGTHFANTTGLHDKNHYSTAKDLAVLLSYALKDEDFCAVFTASQYTASPSQSHPSGLFMTSTLRQEMQENGIEEDRILGGKTGYTSQAGLCLASLLKIGEREYVLVTAHADGDHETKPYHILDVAAVCEKLGELPE